jgi:phage terminase large subunit GpA-like protein
MSGQNIKDLIKEEYKKCIQDPVYFMKKYCKIQHPKKGKIPFHLYPFQEDVLTDLRNNDYNVILKSRQLGISTLSAGYALWLMTFFSDKNILVIATTQDTAKNLVLKVKVMHEYLPSWLRKAETESNKLSLRFDNGSQIKAVSSSGTSGRSEALSLLIIDEAAFIRNIDEIWTAAQQTLATGGGAIVLSTPNGTGNFFHKVWVGAETKSGIGSRFNPIKLHWTVHPERDQAWRDKQDELLGPAEAAQECDCLWGASEVTVRDNFTGEIKTIALEDLYNIVY